MPIRYEDFIVGPSTLNPQICTSRHNVRGRVRGRGRDRGGRGRGGRDAADEITDSPLPVPPVNVRRRGRGRSPTGRARGGRGRVLAEVENEQEDVMPMPVSAPVNVRRRGRGRPPTGRARGRGHLNAVRPTALQQIAGTVLVHST